MGSSQSQQATQTLSQYTSIINTAMIEIVNENKSRCVALNINKFTTGQDCFFELNGGNINITQRANANCSLSALNESDVNIEFDNTIENKTVQFIDAQEKSEQSWLATALSLQVQGASTSAQIANEIMNEFQANIVNTCSNEASAINNN